MNTHDHIFKQIFRNFFGDLLDLTMPWLKRARARPRFLPTEFFVDRPKRRRRQVDLAALVLARRGAPSPVVHVEIESRATQGMDRRMCEYNLLLRLGYRRSVVPLVVYLKGGPQPGVDRITVEDQRDGFTLGRLHYLAFSLARSSAREYLERPEPLAWALAALMEPGEWPLERLRKECESRIRGAGLPAGEREQLLECVRQYLPQEADAVRYDASTQGGTMIAPEKIDLLTIDPEELTPLSRIEYRGWKLGMADGERKLLLSQLEARFGPLSDSDRARLEAIDSTEELERLGRRLLEAGSLCDLGFNGAAGPEPRSS